MKRKQIDFTSKWRLAGTISAVVCIISFVLVFVPGPNYGIDFAGGTNIIARFSEQVPDSDVRTALAELGYDDASVVRFGESADHFQFLIQTGAVTAITAGARDELQTAVEAEFGEGATVEYDDSSGDRVYVQLPESTYEEASIGVVGADGEPVEGIALYSLLQDPISDRLENALHAAGFAGSTAQMYGNPTSRRFQANVQTLQSVVAASFTQAFPEQFMQIDRVETVGPRVGAQLRNDAVKAVLFALVGILLYIAVRFDLRYAPGAVVALTHDVLITLGIFVIFQIEISLPILAALLTIVGYSLNDTIVNFDRIRENLELSESRANLTSIVNTSLNECLSRTVLTSVTTLIAVACIFVLGGGLIRSFALAMIIGVIVGTYSSIYIASPLFVRTSRYMDAQAAAQAERASAIS